VIKIGKIEKLNADDAIKRKELASISNEELAKKIEISQDERFKDIYSLRFGWKVQQASDGVTQEKKLISMMPSGKIVFLDRSQKEEDVIPEDPYICLIFETPKVAFAKVLFPEYQPKIYVPPSRLPVLVWRDAEGRTQRERAEGDSYETRLVNAVKRMEVLGIESFKIIFRKNQRTGGKDEPQM